jgi:hypothetical protein
MLLIKLLSLLSYLEKIKKLNTKVIAYDMVPSVKLIGKSTLVLGASYIKLLTLKKHRFCFKKYTIKNFNLL